MNKKKNKYFGSGTEIIDGKEWSWDKFETTKDYPVSNDLLKWIIGQEKAMEECDLCLSEWIHKLKYLKKRKWWRFWEKAESEKPSIKEQLPAGPFLLLLGDAGTGKSLLGRALADKLTELYKKHDFKLFDVLSWANKQIPSEPRISIHPAGEGRKIVNSKKIQALKKSRFTKWFFNALTGILFGFGIFILVILIAYMTGQWIGNVPVNMGFAGEIPLQELYDGNVISYIIDFIIGNAFMFYMGIGSLFSGGMLFFFKRLLGGIAGGVRQGVGGAESTDAPKLIVDNSDNKAPFIDATGHGSSQLFGSIAWDPYQTGGLGTPEHQRVTAGDVHRAFMGILYCDEVKNLQPDEAVTLLTVLEDGQLPIALRSRWHGGDTAAMSVSTEPVPCMTFLVAAGNFDSIGAIHPALMDRIYGYGKVVRMNNDMPNTVENRRKYVQFIAQECKRFNLEPFSQEAVQKIIDEASRRSGKVRALTTKFRPMISIIKTSAVLARSEGFEVVQAKHIDEAIVEHCKSIQAQLLEHYIKEEELYKYVNAKAPPKIGQVYGLGVISDSCSGEMAGSVLPVKASIIKKKQLKGIPPDDTFTVTGISQRGTDIFGEEKGAWINDSIMKVRHVMRQLYGVNLAKDFMTHIDFMQEQGVDGPSAGVTMSIALASCIERRPIRQDTAVTGEININEGIKVGDAKNILVTPIGGLYHKIKAAERWNFKRVLVPKRNFEQNINIADYKVEVIPCENLQEYLDNILVEPEDEKKKKS